jgi:hypothetical protein
MSKTLQLILFTQSYFFPQSTAHWALYLTDDVSTDGKGRLYHIVKLDMAREPEFRDEAFCPSASQTLRGAIVVANDTDLTEEELRETCADVSKHRKYDPLQNNCQNWVTDVLQDLVYDGRIRQEDVDILPKRGFAPISGN